MALYSPLVVKDGRLREIPSTDQLYIKGGLKIIGNITADSDGLGNTPSLGDSNTPFANIYLGTLLLRDSAGTILYSPIDDSTNISAIGPSVDSIGYNPSTGIISLYVGATTFTVDISNTTFDSVGVTTLTATAGVINTLTAPALNSDSATIATLSGGALTSSNFASAVSLVIYDSTGSAVKTLYGAAS